MTKKQPAPTPIRFNAEDERQLKFIQEKLSAPGLRITKADVLRRALYAFANQLRAQDQDRRKSDPSDQS